MFLLKMFWNIKLFCIYKKETVILILVEDVIQFFGSKIECVGLFQKKEIGVEDILFWIPLEIFHFFTLGIPDKVKLHPWKFYKIVLDPLKIPRPKTKILGNSKWRAGGIILLQMSSFSSSHLRRITNNLL